MAGQVQEFTDANFQSEVLDSGQTVLVDFWAPWCGPCRAIAPLIDEVAEQYAAQAKVGKVNTDQNPKTATNYQIHAIPTVVVFRNGEVVDRLVGGAINRESLTKAVGG